MPELPEVETVCAGIKPKIEGQLISAAKCNRKDLRIPIPKNFAGKIKNRTVKKVTRRSKYICLHLDDGQVIVLHLGMSGRLFVYDEKPELTQKHDHVLIDFANGAHMVFNDARRFGLVTLTDQDTMQDFKLFKNLGVEPLTKDFSVEYLQTVFANKTKNIKAVLMDASLVVGIGNIYASEILFESGIHPEKSAKDLGKEQIKKIYLATRDVLKRAIKAGGSTIRDYSSSDGNFGYFQHQFKVYGQDGNECSSCDDTITKLVQQGRSSFYCPSCQKI